MRVDSRFVPKLQRDIIEAMRQIDYTNYSKAHWKLRQILDNLKGGIYQEIELDEDVDDLPT